MSKRRRPSALEIANAIQAKRQRTRGFIPASRIGGVFSTRPRTSFGQRQASINRQVAGVESKYLDTAISTDATTTAVVVALSTMASGTTNITRDGNKVAWKSINLRLRYNLEAITVNSSVRMILVYDKQSNAAALTSTQLVDSITMESQKNISFLGRFIVLMDKVITLNQTASNAGGIQRGFFKKYIKIPLNAQLANYQTGASAIPQMGALSLLYFGTEAAGASDVDMNGSVRVKFIG